MSLFVVGDSDDKVGMTSDCRTSAFSISRECDEGNKEERLASAFDCNSTTVSFTTETLGDTGKELAPKELAERIEVSFSTKTGIVDVLSINSVPLWNFGERRSFDESLPKTKAKGVTRDEEKWT